MIYGKLLRLAFGMECANSPQVTLHGDRIWLLLCFVKLNTAVIQEVCVPLRGLRKPI